MSIDQLNELEDLLPKLSSAITAIRLDDTAKRALEELKDAPRQAKRFEAFVRAIQTLGPGCGDPIRGPLIAALRQVEEVGDALESATDSSSIRDAASDFRGALVPAVGKLELVITEAWRKIVQDQFDPLAGTGALLEVIPATRSLGGQLKTVASKARTLAEHRVPAEEFAATIASLMTSQAELRNQVQTVSGGRPEIDHFLEALTENTATLRHMTPGVIAWLSANEALDAFAVRAAS